MCGRDDIVTEWRIHLGVHKTATTHLQTVLNTVSGDLADRGISHVPIETLRPATDLIFRPPGLRRRLFGAKQPPLWQVLTGLAGPADTIVLSEENWMGEAWEACLAPPYPQMEQRLAKLADPPKGDSLHLYLSIRHPADFATSVVGEALRHHPGKVSIDDARAAWLAAKLPWHALVERLSTTFPGTPLTVWPYDSYRAHARTIAETLTGVPITTFPDIPDPTATKRPSAQEVARMTGKGKSLGNESFTLFSPEEHKALGETYKADLAMIRQDFPGVLFDPGQKT